MQKHITSILNQKIVLNVNTSWQPIGYKTVKKAFEKLTGSMFGENKEPPAKAFEVEYEKDENGIYDFSKLCVLRPITWDEWLQLPIRGHDSVIHTIKMQIRVPTVIMSVNMHGNPIIKRTNPTNRDILIRDGYVCQYTNKKYPPSQMNVDHVISIDEWKRRGLPGSPDNWENMVACYAPLNSEKANKSLKEMGLKLIRKPQAPPAVRLSQLIKEIRHHDWTHFFSKFNDKHVKVGEFEGAI